MAHTKHGTLTDSVEGTGTVPDPVANADDTYRLDSSFPAASHRGSYSDAVVVKLLTAATGVGYSVEVY